MHWGKPKAYDPTKIEIQYRVMVAELTTAKKKQQQIVDVNARNLAHDIRAENKKGIYDKAYKISDAKAYMASCDAILDALKNIKENKNEAVASRNGPSPSTEDSFRIVCCSTNLLKLDSFKKFVMAVSKEMFEKKVATDLLDTSKCDEQVLQGLQGGSHDDAEIKSVIREAAEVFSNVEAAEKVLGIKLTEEEPQPEPKVQPAPMQNNYAPQQFNTVADASLQYPTAPPGHVAYTSCLSDQVSQHPNLFVCEDLEPIDRSLWPSILADIKAAIA
ncbi:hypothetical protein TVAG_121530 [Trichomonas vaginalis G3]|uniref:Uncharacterized protein n=1 Tax=Trichomonas vaginalis (strain ATCC PRA-98 / G3) TaxID=412133 RepID=A2E964_TRIV3|nr:hypothetical protein TVAGG3_0421710 [Trichomonas vaginalis G3]EAY10749.1 hypothetical protein TVAG_121530 [Trichomonas vaginalis G3]KAI5536113.1 hypothetical protein TVAGG3_0421710 [Trichomonas vaginalis G3]|eukprot:XP_001322972.1 hypothetical protein [Trichomonas vaginalis G3]